MHPAYAAVSEGQYAAVLVALYAVSLSCGYVQTHLQSPSHLTPGHSVDLSPENNNNYLIVYATSKDYFTLRGSEKSMCASSG